MGERRAILASDQQHLALVGGHEESRAAEKELLELIVLHLAECYPERFRLEKESKTDSNTWTIESRLEGLRWKLQDYVQAPLLLAGLLVQEEICLMRAVPWDGEAVAAGDAVKQHIFTAGVVTE